MFGVSRVTEGDTGPGPDAVRLTKIKQNRQHRRRPLITADQQAVDLRERLVHDACVMDCKRQMIIQCESSRSRQIRPAMPGRSGLHWSLGMPQEASQRDIFISTSVKALHFSRWHRYAAVTT